MTPATLLPLLEMLALLVPRLLAPLATKLQQQLMLYRNANGCLTPITLAAICSRRPSDVRDMERLLVLARHCASLYAAMLQALQVTRFSSGDDIDTAAKELCLRRLVPSSGPPLLPPEGSRESRDAASGSGEAMPNVMEALLTFLLHDAMVQRMESGLSYLGAEAWEADGGGSKSVRQAQLHAHDAARAAMLRHEAVGAVKSALSLFCVLDEDRRFDLFSLTARLEARWQVAMAPAVMKSLAAATEQMLYQAAIERMLRGQIELEGDGERALESAWLTQELPRRASGGERHVLVLVSNRAVYLLVKPRGGPGCSVCEPWLLCPRGPRLLKRIVHHRIARLVLDFSAAYGAGHRFRLELSAEKNGGAKGPGAKGGEPPMLQFSALCVGVPQRLLAVLRQAHPRHPRIILESALPRVIQSVLGGYFDSGVSCGVAGGDSGEPAKVDGPADEGAEGEAAAALEAAAASSLFGAKEHLPAGTDPSEAVEGMARKPPPVVAWTRDVARGEGELRLVMRCRKVVDGKTLPRLLVVTDTHLVLFKEDPAYFALVPLSSLPTAQRKGAKDGELFIKIEDEKSDVLELSTLEKIRLVQSSDPQVELFIGGDDEDPTVTIEFACDTGSTLFRNALRQAIWGLGSFRSLLSRWDR